MDAAELNLAPSLELHEVPAWQTRFPKLALARQAAIEVIQHAGEAIFVPSGWHHSVENLQDTASINHNWINGFNVDFAVQHLTSTWRRASHLLEDCRCAF